MTIIWWLLIIILFAVAFIGLIVPVIPDGLLLLAGLAVYYFFIDSSTLSVLFWVVAIIVVIFVMAVDYIASAIGAKTYEASKWSVVTSVIGIIVFPLFMGPLGIIVGPFVMVVATELILQKAFSEALKAGVGTLLGFLGGVFVKGMLMTAVIIWFLILVV